MFKTTSARTVDEYVDALAEPRRGEMKKLHEMIVGIAPNLEVKLWGAIIGYGSYHYKYASGREGDWFVIGLASQKNYISLYVCASDDREYLAEKYRDKLPKASIGKSCVRFKRLADVDMNVVNELIVKGSKWRYNT